MFLGWTIFVEISSLTKSTIGLATSEWDILWGETLFIASAKSFIRNGFKSQFQWIKPLFWWSYKWSLFFLLFGQNLFDWDLNLLSKSFILFSIVFLFGTHSLVKQIRTVASTWYIAAATWSRFFFRLLDHFYFFNPRHT